MEKRSRLSHGREDGVKRGKTARKTDSHYAKKLPVRVWRDRIILTWRDSNEVSEGYERGEWTKTLKRILSRSLSWSATSRQKKENLYKSPIAVEAVEK